MVGVWLESQGLARVYGRRMVLADISFRAGAGELWAVLGSNGSGKSTLLRVLAGLLRPSRGSSWVEAAGRRFDGPERRALLGMVSPDIAPYEELSGIENLAFAARMRGISDEREELLSQLERVGLAGAGDRFAGEYSSGMRQRLKLALAVQARPPILLLDEPTALLDETGRACVHRLVEQQLEHGLVMWATNEPEELPTKRHEIQLALT